MIRSNLQDGFPVPTRQTPGKPDRSLHDDDSRSTTGTSSSDGTIDSLLPTWAAVEVYSKRPDFDPLGCYCSRLPRFSRHCLFNQTRGIQTESFPDQSDRTMETMGSAALLIPRANRQRIVASNICTSLIRLRHNGLANPLVETAFECQILIVVVRGSYDRFLTDNAEF